jgi:hypothetical protein
MKTALVTRIQAQQRLRLLEQSLIRIGACLALEKRHTGTWDMCSGFEGTTSPDIPYGRYADI